MMLEVDRVDLHYGAAIALRQVSLTAEVGAVTCLLGRNGVGKTSLLRAITGAHPISAGAIRWEGADITRLPIHDRARRGIAWVPQGRDIFPLLTVRENLETGFAVLPRGQRRVPDEMFDLFPVLKTMLRRRGGDLSGGQQQQLAIARALVMKPRLLVLDEPTEGIQPSIIKDIGRVIALLRSQGEDGHPAGRTVFRFRARPRPDDCGDGSRRYRVVGAAGGAERGGCTTPPVSLTPTHCNARWASCAWTYACATGTPRWKGCVRSGCLKARFPRPEDAGWLNVVTLNTSGGIAGGDRLDSSFTVGTGARATIAAQAAERFYRALPGSAPSRVRTRIAVADGAAAEWLPQDTILFDRCCFDRQLQVDLADSASFLGVETLVFGRSAMGEIVDQARLRDAVSIRRGGRLVLPMRSVWTVM